MGGPFRRQAEICACWVGQDGPACHLKIIKFAVVALWWWLHECDPQLSLYGMAVFLICTLTCHIPCAFPLCMPMIGAMSRWPHQGNIHTPLFGDQLEEGSSGNRVLFVRH